MLAIYARQSIEKKDSVSIEAQIEKCKYYCGDIDYKIYKDAGYSGKNINRPQFTKLLEDIKSGLINKVIAYRLDRISRSIADFSQLLLMFEKYNVKFISATENFDTDTPMGRAMINIVMTFAQLERETIVERVTDNYYFRANNGYWAGGYAPYGYKKSVEDKHKLVIDEPQARVIKRIYEEYSTGKTLTEISKNLNAEKIPSPNNNKNNGETRYKWRTDTLRRMLSNKVYLGHTEYGKRINLSYKSKKVKYIHPEDWKIVYNTHEPIITEELFCKVQRLKNMNKTIKRKKHEWILNGLVKCKECGAKMTLKVEYKRNNPNELKSKRVCCLNGLKRYIGKKCIKGSRGLDEDILNQIVYKNLKEVMQKLVDKDKVKQLIVNRNNENIMSNSNNNREILDKELAKIEKEIKTLYLDYKQDLLDEDDYKKYYKEKSNEKNRIKKEIEILEKEEKHKPVINEKEISELVNKILDVKEINKDIISELIYDIQIDKDNQIYINYRYDILNKEGLNERI